MTQQTRQWLRELHLPAMEKAYAGQLELPASGALGFDERFALLLQAELESRGNKKLMRLLKSANLKDKKACLEEIDFEKSRNINKSPSEFHCLGLLVLFRVFGFSGFIP